MKYLHYTLTFLNTLTTAEKKGMQWNTRKQDMKKTGYLSLDLMKV